MKRFLILLATLFCGAVFADTINLHWKNYDGSTYEDSTCVIDSDLILPSTTPTRYGYTFTGWKIVSYIPIEYLESTGTQWINTGYYANNGMLLESKGQVVNGEWFIGSYNGSSPDTSRNLVNYRSRDNLLVCQKRHLYSETYGAPVGNEPFTVVMDTRYTTFVGIINDTQIFNTITDTVAAQTNTVTIARDPNGVIKSGRFYYVKIWNSNNTLVRDFIPVLDMNGVPCLFDRVEAKFYYNQGTGQFVAGPAL